MVERDFPFHPFPIGWYQVAYSDELERGEAKAIKYFGQELVLFRTEGGEAKVLDAYCPHLGAHLGHGGKVEGETVRCPFHSWAFDGEGTCVDIPYAKKIPPKATLRSWPVHEESGLIMVWQHPLGEAPTFELPRVDEFYSDGWTDYERRRWQLRTRNQEMAENAVDTAHFHYVHGTQTLPQSKAEIEGPILHVFSTTGMDTPRGGVDGSIESLSHGFGFGMVRFKGIVETLLISSVTAIDEEYVDVRFSFMVKKTGDADVTRGVGKAFISEVSRQLDEDKPIWENKIHHDRPVLCDGDGAIGVFRKWCRQFYVDTDGTSAAASAA